MKNRFTPLTLKNLTLKNRVVVPPMASETSTQEGFVTPKTIEHYERLASSGTSLVMVEYTFVHVSGRSEEFQLGLAEDAQIEGVKKIASVIKAQGAVAGIQLTHSGGKTQREYTGGVLFGPSSVPVPVKDQIMEAPESMTLLDIENWKTWFMQSVVRAVAAGFDLVELHAAHGYGINQWLSPLTNHRDDEYGGSVENNARLLFEIVTAIKERFPHLLLSVRMPGQDFLEGGLSQEDCAQLAQKLENLGVDLINISSGIGGWRRPRHRSGEGYLLDEARFIQSRIITPVIGVGGIESGAFIDQQIQEQHISLAAVGRAILKDPKQWGDENLRSLHV